MIGTLLANPIMAIVVVIVAVILGKIFKISATVLKWIILVGIAYILVTSLGVF